MHDIRYDAVHDEFLVANPFAQAILVFRGGADGEEAPIRVIQGTQTQLASTVIGGVDLVEVDPIHNEILVPTNDSILVFPRDANGDVPPIRTIKGPDTQLRDKGNIAVDPVHNIIVYSAWFGSASLLMFNRTDYGNIKPHAIITGPKTGIVHIAQLQIYSPKGWIVAAQQGSKEVEPKDVFVGVWSIQDNGNTPPRWKIGGPKSRLKRPRGVALDPQHKEIIVADMRLNAVLTYYFPEMF